MSVLQPAADEPIPRKLDSVRGSPWYVVAFVLASAVVAVYWQVGGHGFVNIDDGVYVYENPVVLQGLTLEGISWAFSTFHAANWHPLTWLSHMLDVELFGTSAGGHHLMNLLYHLMNTEFLFFILWRMTGGFWQSAFVAALFGVHPLHVESVAWIAERKDVLSTLFWILTMGAYLRYTRRPGTGRYLLLTVVFALGLMCKPMLVTLPFVLLLLDWWPLGRIAPSDSLHLPSWTLYRPVLSRLVWEKVPLLCLSAISCAITFLAQARGGAVESIKLLPFGVRVANAFASYFVYLGKMLWPTPLGVYYPYPENIHAYLPAWKVAGAILLFCGLSVMALRQRHGRPSLAVGWLWYVGTLIPVIGLVQVGAQAYADRYTYVPLIGIFIGIAWGIPPAVTGRRFRRFALLAFAGVLLVALTLTAWVQTGYWRDSVTLLSRTVTITERNWFALNNLGVSYNSIGQYQQAIGYFLEALRIHPDNAEALNNLGRSCNGLGQYQQAIGYIRKSLQIQPDNAKAWNNLGVSYGELGQHQQAIVCFREALRIQPGNPETWNNLGLACNRIDQHQQAIGYYREALRIRPDHADVWNNLGMSYNSLGQHQKAVASFLEALRIKPDFAGAWNNLGVSYAKLGQFQQAINCFQEALRINPDFVEAMNNLGASYNSLRR
jgi:tetratricopeptide (TPR) repeat protein